MPAHDLFPVISFIVMENREKEKMVSAFGTDFPGPVGIGEQISVVPQVPSFNFFSGPGGLSQKRQTGLDARVIRKTSDADGLSHHIPAITLDQPDKHHFQRYAVQGVLWVLLFYHGDTSPFPPKRANSAAGSRYCF
jgi:hypothetical protein